MNDGTFGVTGGTEAIDADTIERLETHSFDSVKTLQWRNRRLDFSSLANLHDSLGNCRASSALPGRVPPMTLPLLKR